MASKHSPVSHSSPSLPKVCWQVRYLIPWQRVASVIRRMVLTLLYQFHECTYVPWILHNTLSLHFWKWLYSHSLLFWLNLWTLVSPLYLKFAACLFYLLWSHCSDPHILCRIYLLPFKSCLSSFTWYLLVKSSVLVKCLKIFQYLIQIWSKFSLKLALLSTTQDLSRLLS